MFEKADTEVNGRQFSARCFLPAGRADESRRKDRQPGSIDVCWLVGRVKNPACGSGPVALLVGCGFRLVVHRHVADGRDDQHQEEKAGIDRAEAEPAIFAGLRKQVAQ